MKKQVKILNTNKSKKIQYQHNHFCWAKILSAIKLTGCCRDFFSEPSGSLDCGAPAPLLNFKT